MYAEFSTVALWGYGLAAVVHALFALYLLGGWRSGLAARMLLFAVVASLLWAAGTALFVWAPGAAPARLGGLLEVLRVACWYAFLLVLLRSPGTPPLRWMLVACAAVVGAMLAAVLLPAGGKFLLGSFLAAAVLGLMLVEQLFRALPGESRWGFKPLCLGLAAGWMFELYFFADGFLFARLDGDVWAVRGLVHAMVVPLVAMSAARNPVWTSRIAVSREVVFHSTALVVAGAYLLVIAAAGYYVRYLGGDWGRALQVALLFAGLLLLGLFIGSGASRARLRVLLDKHLFPYRYDYRNEWLRFTQALSSADDALDLGQSVIKALSDLVESPGGGLWLRTPDGRYVQHARLNTPPCPAAEPAEGALCAFLAAREWVVNLEEFRMRRSHYGSLELPDWLLRLDSAWLVIPLKSGGRLVGFVVLNAPRAPFEIDWEVLDLLKTAQRQAASYLARMQVTEALIEARKFDAFNRMSAFVVHDLKNLVAQLSLMLKNAERHRDNPEFQRDMLETVAHVETRMRALMAQLQEKSPIEAPRQLDLMAVAERIAFARRGARPAPVVESAAEAAAGLPVSAHAERLERVLGHLVQNALDATPEAGNVRLTVRDCGDGFVAFEVEDSGCGMPAEFIRERLARPFQTTKEGGMGLGVYEASQYIRELGGSLRYHSEEGRGTRAEVRLPRCVRPADADPAERAAAPASAAEPLRA
ncbi:PEP-CTERM system histidine kinase PrsK [Pseudothauera nasutitermitis]|uniref:histidine kinase n=1 Tax=Pseudothauera nasutitermitis TaxID=2565930 RepID=A0A4S4B1H5_9RHOO|nr:XrtA/PEP-CTERM system histidine kinase PrsK [Pseudothauera nasutitermitis]THF65527.1 PEP-CTERM system histidine kinase PrsK [Pseudothauera nasutitermitis]